MTLTNGSAVIGAPTRPTVLIGAPRVSMGRFGASPRPCGGRRQYDPPDVAGGLRADRTVRPRAIDQARAAVLRRGLPAVRNDTAPGDARQPSALVGPSRVALRVGIGAAGV